MSKYVDLKAHLEPMQRERLYSALSQVIELLLKEAEQVNESPTTSHGTAEVHRTTVVVCQLPLFVVRLEQEGQNEESGVESKRQETSHKGARIRR
jgi:hypothetical protein